MKPKIKVAFASGPDDLNGRLVERMRELFPDLPLYVVSEFPPQFGNWVPYHVNRSLLENLARCRAEFTGKRIRLAGVLLVPKVPYRRMRLIALLLSPIGFVAFNENLDSFMLRPRSLGTIARHLSWRTGNLLRSQFRRLARLRDWRLTLLYRAALAAGWLRWARPRSAPVKAAPLLLPGISVIIPSRNGGELLARLLPGLCEELRGIPSEVIVVDNGSHDGSAEWLQSRGIVLEQSREPLSFAGAVNRGLARARHERVCLLNNDMVLRPGFFAPLRSAFEAVPDLFCATAQIVFPEGVRREETGKAVMAHSNPFDFPVRCDEPIPGENLSYVLYGSGGCSLYDAAKLRALGGADEAYAPAYVEDLDLGYRAWQRGWPTVFVSGAAVEHRHRATTARYFSEKELAAMLEINYLRFLARAVTSPKLFRRLWRQAVWRLRVMRAAEALDFGSRAPLAVETLPSPVWDERLILAIGGGDAAVFPGRSTGKTPILIASPYVPFPLAHGGAVRVYNLMRQAAGDFDQVLVAFSEKLETAPRELLEICAEVVLVRRAGSHSPPSTDRPETVEEFDSPAFHAVLQQTVRKWQPVIAQLEFTQMAQYAPDCAPAKTILVEHDITFDLWEQLARESGGWEAGRQLARWRRFEPQAWRSVDMVVTMSEKDRQVVTGAPAVVIPNGVDLERFQPASDDPEPGRLLFIGSFAHRPNVMAVEFFLTEIWPLIQEGHPTLHIIAGARHERFPVKANLKDPRIELEGFVADVRPAYARAALVIAPLSASAGTNIKILEAMAMGKAIVSTPAGINGLDLTPGRDIYVTNTAGEMASAIVELLGDPARRRNFEQTARETAVNMFGWDRIGRRQLKLFNTLSGRKSS